MDVTAFITWMALIAILFMMAVGLARKNQSRFARLSKRMSDHIDMVGRESDLVLKWDQLDIREYLVLLSLDAIIVAGVLLTNSPQAMSTVDVSIWLLIIVSSILILPTVICYAISRSYQKIFKITADQIIAYRFDGRERLSSTSMAWKDVVRVGTIGDENVTNLKFESNKEVLIVPTAINDISSLYEVMVDRLPPLVLSSSVAGLMAPSLRRSGKQI